MNKETKVIMYRVGLIQLAEQLGNGTEELNAIFYPFKDLL